RVRLVRTRTDCRDAVADAAGGRRVAPDIAGGPGGRAQLVDDLVRVAAGAGHLARAVGAGVRRGQADVVRRGLRAVDRDRVVAVDVTLPVPVPRFPSRAQADLAHGPAGAASWPLTRW